jgi:hypothetical protein
MDDDVAVEEQHASARLGVGALHKPGCSDGLHLLRFQEWSSRLMEEVARQRVHHLKLDLNIAHHNSIVNTLIPKTPNHDKKHGASEQWSKGDTRLSAPLPLSRSVPLALPRYALASNRSTRRYS